MKMANQPQNSVEQPNGQRPTSMGGYDESGWGNIRNQSWERPGANMPWSGDAYAGQRLALFHAGEGCQQFHRGISPQIHSTRITEENRGIRRPSAATPPHQNQEYRPGMSAETPGNQDGGVYFQFAGRPILAEIAKVQKTLEMVGAKAEERYEIGREEQKAIDQSLSDKMQQQSDAVGDIKRELKSVAEELKKLQEKVAGIETTTSKMQGDIIPEQTQRRIVEENGNLLLVSLQAAIGPEPGPGAPPGNMRREKEWQEVQYRRPVGRTSVWIAGFRGYGKKVETLNEMMQTNFQNVASWRQISSGSAIVQFADAKAAQKAVDEDGNKTSAFPFGIQARWARANTTPSAGKASREPQQQTRVVLGIERPPTGLVQPRGAQQQRLPTEPANKAHYQEVGRKMHKERQNLTRAEVEAEAQQERYRMPNSNRALRNKGGNAAWQAYQAEVRKAQQQTAEAGAAPSSEGRARPAGNEVAQPESEEGLTSQEGAAGGKAQKGSSARHCPALSGSREEGLNGEGGSAGEGAIREFEETERQEMAGSKERNSSRTSTTQEKIVGPCGGSDRGTDSSQNNGPVTAERQQMIRQTHDQDDSGNWKAGAKKWELHQKTTKSGLCVQRLPGTGNCFWEGVALHVGHQRFSESKTITASFFKSSEYKALQESENFNERFPVLQNLVSEEVIRNLTTDGAYSGEQVMQLAALALQHDITISSTLRPEQDAHTIYRGAQEVGKRAKGEIQLLLRDHQKDTIYNAQFCPIALSDGHFWLIQKTNQGNGGRSALARP